MKPLFSTEVKKIKKHILVVIFSTISFNYSSSCSAEARAFISGKELLRLCDGAVESNYSRATDCLGYITGLSDGHEVFHDLGLIPNQWCWPPDGISNRQMAAIVHKYLQNNPALLDKSAALLAMFALLDAYPCR